MTFAGINYLAVVVAAIASFGFSGLYYMSLAKPWTAALGLQVIGLVWKNRLRGVRRPLVQSQK